MTYSVVVRNPNTWTITDGRRVFEELQRCGHEHQTVASAAACLKELTQWFCLHEEPTGEYCGQCGALGAGHDHTSAAWWHAQVEDSKGNLADVPDPEWDAMYAKAVSAYTSTATPNNRVLAWSVKQALLAHGGTLPPAKAERVHELFCRPVPAWA